MNFDVDVELALAGAGEELEMTRDRLISSFASGWRNTVFCRSITWMRAARQRGVRSFTRDPAEARHSKNRRIRSAGMCGGETQPIRPGLVSRSSIFRLRDGIGSGGGASGGFLEGDLSTRQQRMKGAPVTTAQGWRFGRRADAIERGAADVEPSRARTSGSDLT